MTFVRHGRPQRYGELIEPAVDDQVGGVCRGVISAERCGVIATRPSTVLVDAAWTIRPRSPSAVGCFSTNAAAAKRARLEGPATWSSRVATSVSLDIIDPALLTRRWLRTTTPVA